VENGVGVLIPPTAVPCVVEAVVSAQCGGTFGRFVSLTSSGPEFRTVYVLEHRIANVRTNGSANSDISDIGHGALWKKSRISELASRSTTASPMRPGIPGGIASPRSQDVEVLWNGKHQTRN
jgi:hypothetical protein